MDANRPFPAEECSCDGGVSNGFWHSMELLSLPWQDQLWWPNSTAFKQAKVEIEQKLDNLYIGNRRIFELGYVRSIVFKMQKGNFQLINLKNTSNTTNTTSSGDSEDVETNILREYVLRGMDKFVIEPKGKWDHEENLTSTKVWVEHQFAKDFTVKDFDKGDFYDQHMEMLHQRDGQWTRNVSSIRETESGTETVNETMIELWISQSCYYPGLKFCSIRGERLMCDENIAIYPQTWTGVPTRGLASCPTGWLPTSQPIKC